MHFPKEKTEKKKASPKRGIRERSAISPQGWAVQPAIMRTQQAGPLA